MHFWWLVKADVTEPLRWAVAVAALFLIRVWFTYQKRQKVSSAAARA